MSNPNTLITEVLHVDSNEVDNGMLPPHLVGEMARNVVRTLERAGIDTSAVYFRGRKGQIVEDVGAAHYRKEEVSGWNELPDDPWMSPDELIAEQQAHDDPYGDILDERDSRNEGIEKALEYQIDGPPTPEYVLGRLDALLDEENGDNPLYAAGVSEENAKKPHSGSYLDVYSMPMIDSFEPDIPLDDEGNYAATRVVTSVTEEQLGLAALACVRLNYKIVNEDIY